MPKHEQQTTLYCTQREYDAWVKEGKDMTNIRVGGDLEINWAEERNWRDKYVCTRKD